jgi:hypothetical protein
MVTTRTGDQVVLRRTPILRAAQHRSLPVDAVFALEKRGATIYHHPDPITASDRIPHWSSADQQTGFMRIVELDYRTFLSGRCRVRLRLWIAATP